MVTAADVKEYMAEDSGEIYIELITLEAAGAEPGYLALNNENVISRGIEFLAADLEYTPRKKSSGELAKARLTMHGVSAELIAALRKAHQEPRVTAELIAFSRPDTVIDSDGPFDLLDVSFSMNSISGALGYTYLLDEQLPVGQFTPSYFPGLFS